MSQRTFPTRLATSLLVSLAFLSACSDSTSPTSTDEPIDGPSLGRGAYGAQNTGYTVLANAAITCTDGTIAGSAGTFQATPTGSITQTTCPISGAVDVGTARSRQAYDAFVAEYDAAAPQDDDVCTVLTGTLDGMTLSPGSYCFPAAATLTGTLTLSGPSSGIWEFSVGTEGTGALTGTNFFVVLANGAQGCNVSWWVAEAATMTTSRFEGSIMAGAAITLTGGTFGGDAWSQADVTVTGTAVDGCGGRNGTGKPRCGCHKGTRNGPEGCDQGKTDRRRHSHDDRDHRNGHNGHDGNNGHNGRNGRR